MDKKADESWKERSLEMETFIRENTPEILEAKLTKDKNDSIELLCRVSVNNSKEKKLIKISISARPARCEKTGFLLLSHLDRLKGTYLTKIYEDPKCETFYNKDGEFKSYTLHICCIHNENLLDFMIERRVWDYQWIENEGGYTHVEISKYNITANQVIILIALPASGKTEMCKRYTKLGYLIYDDFLQDFYKGEILEQISLGKRVCLADPRLCIPKTFESFIEKVSAFASDYFVVCFENDPTQCLINNDLRYSTFSPSIFSSNCLSSSKEESREKIKEMKDNDILNFSKLYDLSIYEKHPHKIIPVYKKKEKDKEQK